MFAALPGKSLAAHARPIDCEFVRPFLFKKDGQWHSQSGPQVVHQMQLASMNDVITTTAQEAIVFKPLPIFDGMFVQFQAQLTSLQQVQASLDDANARIRTLTDITADLSFTPDSVRETVGRVGRDAATQFIAGAAHISDHVVEGALCGVGGLLKGLSYGPLQCVSNLITWVGCALAVISVFAAIVYLCAISESVRECSATCVRAVVVRPCEYVCARACTHCKRESSGAAEHSSRTQCTHNDNNGRVVIRREPSPTFLPMITWPAMHEQQDGQLTIVGPLMRSQPVPTGTRPASAFAFPPEGGLYMAIEEGYTDPFVSSEMSTDF
jgi:hypothetical protein